MSDTSPSTDLAQKYPSLVAMVDRLSAAALIAVEDPTAIQMQIVGRMLEADDEDTLFALQEAGTIAAADWLNTPFRLKYDGIAIRKSTLEGSTLPWYVLLSVTDFATGNAFAINTGAPSIIGILDKLMQWEEAGKGSFSLWDSEGGRAFQIVGKGMSGGNTLLHLIPLEKMSAKAAGKTSAGKK